MSKFTFFQFLLNQILTYKDRPYYQQYINLFSFENENVFSFIKMYIEDLT